MSEVATAPTQETETQGAAVIAPAPEATAAPETTQADAGEARTFTQDEVNEIVKKRLERAGRATERELADRVQREVDAAIRRYVPAKAEVAVSEEAPKRDDFDSYEDFIRAEARYVAKQEFRAEREAAQKAEREAKEKASRDDALRQFDERKAATAAKYEDFEDALEVAKRLPITDAMFEAMVRTPEGWDIVHHFGTHPDEAHRIATLPPYAQAAEIGKLAARVAVGAQGAPATVAAVPAPTKSAPVSKAPEPIKPGGESAKVEKDPVNMTDAEFAAWRKRQIAQRR